MPTSFNKGLSAFCSRLSCDREFFRPFFLQSLSSKCLSYPPLCLILLSRRYSSIDSVRINSSALSLLF